MLRSWPGRERDRVLDFTDLRRTGNGADISPSAVYAAFAGALLPDEPWEFLGAGPAVGRGIPHGFRLSSIPLVFQ